MKYVVVTGGVVSGLGKGITASSLGLLLKESGLHVTAIKIDPYLNIDAGTMSPYEHGEVYVLDDGGEADLDLGNYERFLDVRLTRDHNITTGKVYDAVLRRERRGEYLGKTVQVVPHISGMIQDWLERVAPIPVTADGVKPDVCIIELGGTVGDIESMVFLEALRQFQARVGRDNFCLVHVSLVPSLSAVGEQKSKPTQHSCRELRAAGLMPDFIMCRAHGPLSRSVKEKIALFSMVPPSHVLALHDVPNIYQVPGVLMEQSMPGLLMHALRLNRMPPTEISLWQALADRMTSAQATPEVSDDEDAQAASASAAAVGLSTRRRKGEKKLKPSVVKIALVGKYTGLSDSYLSVVRALDSAAGATNVRVTVEWIDSGKLELEHRNVDEHDREWARLEACDGILCPGGFGDRGVEGKIRAVQYAREHQVPFLGICLGMQVMVIEYARHVVGMEGANSAEMDADTAHPVVIFMPEIDKDQMGGNMRLGLRKTLMTKDTLSWRLYGSKDSVDERHRHRYEVNPDVVDQLAEAGLVFAGTDEARVRMEMVELPGDKHRFFFGCQFHPEFLSRPLRPSPPFLGLVRASAGLECVPPPSSLRPSPTSSATSSRRASRQRAEAQQQQLGKGPQLQVPGASKNHSKRGSGGTKKQEPTQGATKRSSSPSAVPPATVVASTSYAAAARAQ